MPILRALCKLTAPVNAWKLGPLRFSRIRIELVSPALQAFVQTTPDQLPEGESPDQQGAEIYHFNEMSRPAHLPANSKITETHNLCVHIDH